MTIEVSEDRRRVAQKLSEMLVDLRAREALAKKAGDSDALAELQARIAAIEATIAMLLDRVDAMAAQSWRFDVNRDPDTDLMTSIIASPIGA